ncbi:unnamed protein product [Brachionus calyciflorus]|uniref:Uncharacterized protein n=1 Tax=Brachionus calyciflorus TaxID=104777 RepID=A0A813M325_9BILA|nr:unnamed protein product [Brachionus calyciflorus]
MTGSTKLASDTVIKKCSKILSPEAGTSPNSKHYKNGLSDSKYYYLYKIGMINQNGLDAESPKNFRPFTSNLFYKKFSQNNSYSKIDQKILENAEDEMKKNKKDDLIKKSEYSIENNNLESICKIDFNSKELKPISNLDIIMKKYVPKIADYKYYTDNSEFSNFYSSYFEYNELNDELFYKVQEKPIIDDKKKREKEKNTKKIIEYIGNKEDSFLVDLNMTSNLVKKENKKLKPDTAISQRLLKKRVSFQEHVLETHTDSGNSILKPIIFTRKKSFY